MVHTPTSQAAHQSHPRRTAGRPFGTLVTAFLAALIGTYDVSAQVGYTVVADLSSIGGAVPLGGVVRGADGALYGTTSEGGAGNCGLVYRLDPAGQLSVVHHFSAPNGCRPVGELALGPGGNLYGVTNRGGDVDSQRAAGTIYKIAGDGTFSVLHRLVLPVEIPSEPWLIPFRPSAGLTLAQDGFLYGTLESHDVFRISPDGVFSLVHQFFPGGPDGSQVPLNLQAALTVAADGNLYSTSPTFELLSATTAAGTVFRVSLVGDADILRHFFVFRAPDGSRHADEGAFPAGELAAGPGGEIYGANSTYGPSVETDRGTLFRRDPDGTFTVLHVFSEGADQSYPDGAGPVGGLMLAADGRVYGKTVEGGANGNGTLFRIGSDGVFEALRSFPADAFTQTKGRLFEASLGVFFGTASSAAGGVVYRVDLSAPLSIELVAPVGGEKIFVGMPTTIAWNATGATSIDVELSQDRGRSFEAIPGCAALPGATTECTWTPTGPPTKVLIRVVAHDAAGGTASDVTSRRVRIKRER